MTVWLRGLAAIAGAGLLLGNSEPPPTIETLVRANAHPLQLRGGHLAGEGGALIARAVGSARIVALGEDHFTREIPAFGMALCNLMASDLNALVVEAGSQATAAVAPMLRGRDRDRERRMARFLARYPNSVAFLDSRADNAFAAHCMKVSRKPHFRLLGVDQEFIGAAGIIIDRILATPLSAKARSAMLALRREERADAAKAAATGDPSKLLLLSIGEPRIAGIERELAAGARPEARRMFLGLAESHRIYDKNRQGTWDSNLVRSELMKRQFSQTAPRTGKILLKFGDVHMYKGVGPLHLRDLGNHVAELADGEGRPSLHILMLGAEGVHATFAGYRRPNGRQPFRMADDPDYRWLGPVSEALIPGSWTVIDLRPFRRVRIAGAGADWRRVIDGYDLLVMVPRLSPSAAIGEEIGAK